MGRMTMVALLVSALTLGCASSAAPPTSPGKYEVPKLVRRVEAEYPVSLRQQHATGSVVIEGIIPKEGGALRDPHVVRSDDPRLDPYALEAVAKWRWTPGTQDGHPVDIKYQTTVRFSVP